MLKRRAGDRLRPGIFEGRTIEDVAGALKSGSLSAKDLPINVVVRAGNTLILNTRSAQALTRAGVPRGSWNVVNRTGDDFFEGLAAEPPETGGRWMIRHFLIYIDGSGAYEVAAETYAWLPERAAA